MRTAKKTLLPALSFYSFACLRCLVIALALFHIKETVTNNGRRNPSLQISIQSAPQCTPKQHSSEPHGATRQQAIAKTHAKLSVYHILTCSLVLNCNL
jgi:hypothetical protein